MADEWKVVPQPLLERVDDESFTAVTRTKNSPSLLLDFANNIYKTQNTGFSRASNATFWDKHGVLQTASPDYLRQEYDPVTGDYVGYLLESESTNYVESSQSFDAPDGWFESNTTAIGTSTRYIETNIATAPDGSNTVSRMTDSTDFDAQRIYIPVFPPSGQTVFSLYMKKGSSRYAGIRYTSSSGNFMFDFVTGTPSWTPGGDSYGYQYVGNGWYRLWIVDDNDNGVAQILLSDDGITQTYEGSGTKSVLIWGAQMEMGSAPTSYIKTIAGSITRAADIGTIKPSSTTETTVATDVLSCVRSSIATYWDSDGILKTAAANEIRFQHDPATGERLGLLAEQSTTNNIPDSTTWNAISGVDSSSTLSEETTDLPPIDSITSCVRVTKNGVRTSFYVYENPVTIATGKRNTFSGLIKPGPGIVKFGSETAGAGRFRFRYDIATDEITTGSSGDITATVKSLSNGWYYFAVTSDLHPGSTDVISFVVDDSVSDDNGAYFITAAWQVEPLDHATTYFPTSGSPATREADNISITGIDDWLNFNTGTWTIDGEFKDAQVLSNSEYFRRISGDGKVVLRYTGNSGEVWLDGVKQYNTLGLQVETSPSLCSQGTGLIRSAMFNQTVINDVDASSASTGTMTAPYDIVEYNYDGIDGFYISSSNTDSLITGDPGSDDYFSSEVGDNIVKIIDNSEGSTLFGPELLSDPTFDVPADWTSVLNFSVAGGIATTTGNGYIHIDATIEDDTLYKVEFEVIRFVTGNVKPLFSDGTTVNGPAASAAGTYTVFMKSVAGHTRLSFQTGSSSDLDIDNVSLKKVIPSLTADQVTIANAPTRQNSNGYDYLQFDGVGDSISIEVPVGGWSGPYVHGTIEGVIVGEISVPAGPYIIPTNGSAKNFKTITDLVIINNVLTEPEIQQIVNTISETTPQNDFSTPLYDASSMFDGRTDLVTLDCSHWNPDFTDVSRFVASAPNLHTIKLGGLISASTIHALGFAYGSSSLTNIDFRGCDSSNVERFDNFLRGTSIPSLDMTHLDTSSCTDIDSFLRTNTNITYINVANSDFSNVIDFAGFAAGCTSLEIVDVYGGLNNNFAGSPCIDYASAFSNTNLTQQSIDDIVTAIELAGTNDGVFDQTGGSAPSIVGELAVDKLRNRGWAIAVTGNHFSVPAIINVNGNKGFWYDITDTTSMLGLTDDPDVAVVDTGDVSLVFDRSGNGIIEPELMSNWDFSVDDLSALDFSAFGGYEPTVGAYIDTGTDELVLPPASTSYGCVAVATPFPAGKHFIEYRINANARCDLRIGSTLGGADYASRASTQNNNRFAYVNADAPFYISFIVSSSVTPDARLQYLSVKQVDGNAADAVTVAATPVFNTPHWLTFDGTDDYLRIVNQAGNHDFTDFDQQISGFFKVQVPTNFGSTVSYSNISPGSCILSLRDNASQASANFVVQFGFHDGALHLGSATAFSETDSGAIGTSTGVTFTANEERTVGFSIDGNDWKIYIDGVLNNSGTFTQAQPISRALGSAHSYLYLGASSGSGGASQNEFQGKIGNSLFVDRVLTDQQFADLHANGIANT